MSMWKKGLAGGALLLCAGVALAQGPAADGRGMGPGPRSDVSTPGASAPGAGPGPMRREGARPGGRYGADYTPGWSMMTEAERKTHRERIQAMKSYEECQAYQAQHREQMAQRAKEKGSKALREPRRDACAGLKP